MSRFTQLGAVANHTDFARVHTNTRDTRYRESVNNGSRHVLCHIIVAGYKCDHARFSGTLVKTGQFSVKTS